MGKGKILFYYNFAQNWYFSERFGTQLIFDMYCTVNKEIESKKMYGENTNTMAIPIYRVLPYPVGPIHALFNTCSTNRHDT